MFEKILHKPSSKKHLLCFYNLKNVKKSLLFFLDISFKGYYLLVMWQIVESRTALKQLKKCPKNIREEYEGWKQVLMLSGPKTLRDIIGYKDHALKGEWKGARASYLNRQWRVIYHVDKKEIIIFVLEINPHDYRKKN